MDLHRARLLALVAGAWAVVWMVNRSLRRVRGPSMSPTLRHGDLVVVVPTRLRAPGRGELVLVDDPRSPDRVTIKRLVGLPGESVTVRPGTVEVDDRRVLQLPGSGRSSRHVWHLGPSQHIVLGDNLPASTDSRQLGPVDQSRLRAVALWRLRPWRRPARLTPLTRAGPAPDG